MYCSLEKLDLGVALPGSATTLLIQTDHRDAAAITDDAARSVIFAVTRCLVARRIGDDDPKLQPFRVVYQLDCDPPAFLNYVVAATGGVIARSVDPPVDEPDVAPQIPKLEALIDDACARLARDVLREPTVRELEAYEQRLVVGEGEHAYYAAIASLGAVAADVVRTRFPDAAWRYSPGAVIPFELARPNITQAVPLFGLAKRFVDARRTGTADPSDTLSLVLGIMLGEIKEVVISAT